MKTLAAYLEENKALHTRENILSAFKAIALEMWKFSGGRVPQFKIEMPGDEGYREPSEGMMAVRYASRPRVLVGKLVSFPSPYITLVVAEKALSKNAHYFTKLLIHEAVHVGIPNHGKDFIETCIKHGGVLSQSGTDDEGNSWFKVSVQSKKGGRFSVEKKFATLNEARVFIASQRAIDGKRRRIQA